jgi:SAM-dependent methyltransferase
VGVSVLSQPRGLTRLVHAAASNTAFFHYTRWIAYCGVTPKLAAALDLAPGERLLDVGCGTGFFAGLAPGPYVGVDTARPSLVFGQRHHPPPRHAFLAMSATHLALADRSIDCALIVNVAHHLPEPAFDALMRELRRVVKRRVVLVDLDPEYGNPLENWFMRRDRGAFLRPRQTLRALAARHWRLEDEAFFHNALHTQPQMLFRLAPPAGE